jgi:hypothetical protein
MSIFVLGLDLGQAQDYTALVIVEVEGTKYKDSAGQPYEALPFVHLAVRHIERFTLGTKYLDIAWQVEQRLRHTPAPRYVACDSTGVGGAVVEMLARIRPAEITITSGNQVQYGERPQQFRVPKRDLVAGLSVGLQNGVLKIAKGLPNAELLTAELLNFRAKITESGQDTYAAWREADHDDIVLGLAIAVWYAELVFRGIMQQVAEAEEQRRLSEMLERSRVSISRF